MMKKEKVANGVYWVDIPEADLRILCGCPADAVKHLFKRGLIGPAEKVGVPYETGPNAILLSDTPIQKGSFANLAEFALLQMFYRQGMLLPGHPNAGRKPLLIGLGDQVRSQAEYVFRGNYGLVSIPELEACGVPPAEAREMMAIKKWFSFGSIHATSDLIEIRALDADAVELAPGCVVHRKGFNRYEFIASGASVEVDLTLGPGEEFEPAYILPPRGARREAFSVIHVGEGDGWDAARPCMGSIVCGGGLFYLVDAGPHIMRSLDALGIGVAEIEGIFHTHSHDDHFAGLTSLVRTDRRLKYYAVPYVRASVQKKLAALMRIDEDRFSRIFEVCDLLPGEWNRVGALEVKPVYSPHPVDTTVFFFRAAAGMESRTYAHLADIASFSVIGKLAEGQPSALTERSRALLMRELTSPADVKKVDAGGGLIHGSAADFLDDPSRRILLSHGVPESPRDPTARVTTAAFGESDVLIPGGAQEFFARTARSCLASLLPRCPPAEIDKLAACPTVEIAAGELVHPGRRSGNDLRLILGGTADQVDPSTGKTRRLGVGALVGEPSPPGRRTAVPPSRARSTVTALSIPARTYRDFLSRNGGAGACREPATFHEALSLCPAFSGIETARVRNSIAAAMQERNIARGTAAPAESEPALMVLAKGEMDIAVGSQLIETLRPGGFWGEERIVSTAPRLSTAQAVTDCSYLVVPSGVLADIPIVQWELLEAFERRLRSFRAGFRFEWSESFRVDVAVLDDEHRMLFSLVNALSQAIGHTGVVEGHDREKRDVLDFTRTHFANEEALMKAHAYPRLETQVRAHGDLLDRLEKLVNATERRARPRPTTPVDYLKDWLIAHTLLEDLQYRSFFAERGVR
ncbi:MAG: hemerythrin domain-containing protein [Spirochaetia bacterium]